MSVIIILISFESFLEYLFLPQKQCFTVQLVIIYTHSGMSERFNSFKIYCTSLQSLQNCILYQASVEISFLKVALLYEITTLNFLYLVFVVITIITIMRIKSE